MKLVVTGASGQLGRELVVAFAGDDVVAFDRLHLDICDFVYTQKVLAEVRPDVVVNAAAFTRVDDCEDEPERAFWVNAYAVRNLAQACAHQRAVLAHVSTDYVFDGVKAVPYSEDDLPNPLSVYGVSKLAGEHFVRAVAPRWIVARTSGLYGAAGAGTRRGNFVETMLRLAEEGRPVRVVADQVLAPTSARDAARAIASLVRAGRVGLYHVTNAGQCSWFEFAREIFRLAELAPGLEPTTAEAYRAKARRPPYSVLAGGRLQAAGLGPLPPWQDALAAYLRERGRLKAGAVKADT